MRHFIDIADFDGATLKGILASAVAMKPGAMRSGAGGHAALLAGKSIAMIFDKPSTRTRVSFEVGIRQLGASPLVLRGEEMQLGRGETIADTARVLSGYVDAIMIRTARHADVLELARYSTVPVINGLTSRSHPCQIMADVLTMAELKAPDYDFGGLKVAWFGDGNNVAVSWIEAAMRLGFRLDLAVPSEMLPKMLAGGGAEIAEHPHIRIMQDAHQAAMDADVVTTDTWQSMESGGGGIEGESGGGGGAMESDERVRLLRPYQITEALMGRAKADAIFMHCLPVYRGAEATAEVVDGTQSVIWHEAKNRLHVQKAIMAFCLHDADEAG